MLTFACRILQPYLGPPPDPMLAQAPLQFWGFTTPTPLGLGEGCSSSWRKQWVHREEDPSAHAPSQITLARKDPRAASRGLALVLWVRSLVPLLKEELRTGGRKGRSRTRHCRHFF